MKVKLRTARSEKACGSCHNVIRPGETYAIFQQYGEEQKQCSKCIKSNKLT